jgi:hypothetical protein
MALWRWRGSTARTRILRRGASCRKQQRAAAAANLTLRIRRCKRRLQHTGCRVRV